MLIDCVIDRSLVRGQSVNVLLAELLTGLRKRTLDDIRGDSTGTILFCVTSSDAKRRDRDPGVTTGCVGNAFEFRSLDGILNQRALCALPENVDELVGV